MKFFHEVCGDSTELEMFLLHELKKWFLGKLQLSQYLTHYYAPINGMPDPREGGGIHGELT
jgi:hypothetical protein